MLGDGDAVELSGHVNVGDEDTERRGGFGDEADSDVGVLCLHDTKPFAGEFVRNDKTDQGLVLNEEDAHDLHRPVRHGLVTRTAWVV